VSVRYGERLFGSDIFGNKAEVVEVVRNIPYRIGTYLSTHTSVGYGERLFGEDVFGGSELNIENERTATIYYGFRSIFSKEFEVPYNWGNRVDKVFTTSYSYKSLVPLLSDLPYAIKLVTSDDRTISYKYGEVLRSEIVIPYSYIAHIAKTALIRYSFSSLGPIFKGTVRKISISSTPSGQVARIELERR